MIRISLVFISSWMFVASQTLEGPHHDKAVVCYVASWAAYRTAPGTFIIEDLDPSLCTHLVYAFAGLDESTNTIKSLDPWQDLERDYGKAGYKRMVSFKQRYPHLKVTLAIGGWNEGSVKYSKMAADPQSRAKFIASVMVFLDTYGFDGLDLDWEYPARREGKLHDKPNYVALVKELKEAFESKGYILTAALGAGKDTMDAAYDLTKLSRYLDLIHMMCYDYHGTWDGVVGANAPVRGSSDQDVLSLEYTIKYMLDRGVSPYKLVLGLPMYGRTYILQDPTVKQIEFGRTAVKSQGFAGPLTKENGFMGYNEICVETSNSSSSWSHHWHNQSETPYLRDKERVITYDNARSIAIKVKLAMDYGLGGLMVWSIDTDDFRGLCQGEDNAYLDFIRRSEEMSGDPVVEKAWKNLNADAKRTKRFSYYTLANNKLQIRLPEKAYTNYNLMRTINEATVLALEEKMIVEEVEKITKENEIEDPGKEKDGAGSVGASFGIVFGCIIAISNLL